MLPDCFTAVFGVMEVKVEESTVVILVIGELVFDEISSAGGFSLFST